MVSPSSRLIFGKYKGCPLNKCPIQYLQWMGDNLLNSDFHEWAIVARTLVDEMADEIKNNEDLEQKADDFLKSHGFNPKNMKQK